MEPHRTSTRNYLIKFLIFMRSAMSISRWQFALWLSSVFPTLMATVIVGDHKQDVRKQLTFTKEEFMDSTVTSILTFLKGSKQFVIPINARMNGEESNVHNSGTMSCISAETRNLNPIFSAQSFTWTQKNLRTLETCKKFW